MVNYKKEIKSLEKELTFYENYVSDEESDDVQHEVLRDDEMAFCENFDSCIIVDNLPVVPEDKYAKLLTVITKLFGQMGEIVDLNMPMNKEKATTSGCAFIEYKTTDEAIKAVKNINNFAMDKKHTLRVNQYADLAKYLGTPEKYTAPVKPEYKELPDLKNWLSDPFHRDMFALRYGSETEIHWSDHGITTSAYSGEREKVDGKQWCSQYVTWSPQGTYFVTFHPKGIALWAGETFKKFNRFAHPGVKIVKFSPQEKYVVTCNNLEGENAIIFWDVQTGAMLRSLPANGEITPFKWSHDDQYVARLGKDVISIYELPSMKILDKKSLKADGIHDFFWSPTDNILSYWAPESANVPARVSLVEIPSRVEIRQKNLFNVSDCRIHWHDGGDFVCVKVTRHSKSKKTLYTNFELFRPREQLVPVEMLEMKETVVAFAWEPKGSRFAVCHGESQQRLNVSFYDMNGGAKNNEVTLLYELKEKQCNHLYWSPQGNYIVLAGLNEMNGHLEFWDVDENQSLAEQEHFKCTNVQWDPSGRVVSSSVCQSMDNDYYKFQMDNGYHLWTFQGKNLAEVRKDAFYQFLWRPRPKTLLTDQQYRDIVKNLKKYERKFHELDRKKERERVAAEKAKKSALRQQFYDRLAERMAVYKTYRADIVALRQGFDSDDDENFIINSFTTDEIISQFEEAA